MWIKLAVDGPAMWFLGKPKNIKVSLNFTQPGPVDVNFEKLSSEEQKQLLTALQSNTIECEKDFQTLYKIYHKAQPVVEAPIEVQQYLQQTEKNKMEDKRLKLESQRREKERKLQERCDYVSTLTVKAIKALVKKEDDTRFLRRLFEMEEAKKNRASVKDFLSLRLKKLQKEIIEEIQNSSQDPAALENTLPQETIQYSVIESEQEIVSFAAGEPLGGE